MKAGKPQLKGWLRVLYDAELDDPDFMALAAKVQAMALVELVEEVRLLRKAIEADRGGSEEAA